jgi:hypothetical protein
LIKNFIALGLVLGMTSALAAPADDINCDKCVEQGDFAPDSISQGKLMTESVTRDHLDDRSVRAHHIAGGSVTQGKIKDQVVTTKKIRDGAVSNEKLTPEVIALIADLQAEIDTLDAYIRTLQAYIEVDETTRPAQPIIRVVAANLQVVNGADATNTINGTGNLIIGYNEAESFALDACTDGNFLTEESCTLNGNQWGQFHRTGSHNLIVGPNHSYSQYGGLVLGFANVVNRGSASISGGRLNISSGSLSTISGGYLNQTPALLSSSTGGNNYAAGVASSASGGSGNTASGTQASVSGGNNRTAGTEFDWAAGGLLEAN